MIQVEVKESVAILTIDNSATNNALTHEMVNDLNSQLDYLKDNLSISVVIVKGNGKFFLQWWNKRAAY